MLQPILRINQLQSLMGSVRLSLIFLYHSDIKTFLFTTLFLAFACSKDDEGETFLDKYDGTSWIVQEQEELDGAGVEIFIFSNGTYIPKKRLG